MPQSSNTINVCLVGQKFMGRTHSNAFLKVGKFFDLPVLPVMHTICGRNEAELDEFKERWGWQHASTDWKKAVTDPGDRPGRHRHAESSARRDVDRGAGGGQARRVRKAAGRHARRCTADARRGEARRRRARRSSGTTTAACRRSRWRISSPRGGKLGRIYHVRAFYLQDWGGPGVPLLWRFQKKFAGSGAHGDLNAHIIDMARFITGDEITEVVGSIAETFIKERDDRRARPQGRHRRRHDGRRARRARATSTTPSCSSPASSRAPSPASKPRASPPATRTRTASRSTARRARSASTSRT